MSINLQLRAVDAATAQDLIANPRRALNVISRLRTPSCDVHKAWQAIHYVLTGSPDGGDAPNCYLLDGGVELGGDTGYGPPRLLRPDEVREFNEVLQPISKLSILRERFDHEAMVEADVYCMNDGDPEEDLEFTAEFFKSLRRFIKDAADAGHGAVVYFT
jgi:hypothetical protein